MRNFFSRRDIIFYFLLAVTVAFPSLANDLPNQKDIDAIPVLEVKPNNLYINKSEKNRSKEKDIFSISYYYKKGREAYLQFTSKGFKDAIESFDKALELDKKYALAIASKAEAQALLSRVIYDINDEEVIAKLELQAFENAYIAADLEPNLSETHRALSMVYFVQKKYQEGKAEAQKSIELNDHDAESYLLLWLNSPDIKILRNDNYNPANYYKALDIDSPILDKILELNPDLQLTYLELGAAYTNQNKYFDALASYKYVIKLNHENEEAFANLGTLYNNTIFLNEAITQFNQALKIEPDRYDAIYGLGAAYLKKKDKEKAMDYFEKACDYDYKDACELIISSGRNPNIRRTKRRIFRNN